MCGPCQKQNTYNHSDKKTARYIFYHDFCHHHNHHYNYYNIHCLYRCYNYSIVVIAAIIIVRISINIVSIILETEERDKQIDRRAYRQTDRQTETGGQIEKKRLLHLPKLICNLRTFHVAKLRMKLVLFATGVDVCVAK